MYMESLSGIRCELNWHEHEAICKAYGVISAIKAEMDERNQPRLKFDVTGHMIDEEDMEALESALGAFAHSPPTFLLTEETL